MTSCSQRVAARDRLSNGFENEQVSKNLERVPLDNADCNLRDADRGGHSAVA
jgi:hypothetical protein